MINPALMRSLHFLPQTLYHFLLSFRRMKNGVGEVLRAEQTAVKTAFLSYYISMYNTVNKEIGYPDTQVTVDEIYDFIQDLKHEAGREVPDIRKADISSCFRLLHASGVCRP